MTMTTTRPQPPSTRGMKFPVEVLTAEEVRRLLDKFSRRAPSGVRNRALVTLLYRAGLRIAEALTLELRDIDFERGSVTVRHGKGDRRRVVGVDGSVLDTLERWLVVRRRLGASRTTPVFCQIERGRIGLPLDASYVRKALKRKSRAAAITKRIHPHGLRHACLSEMAHEGVALPIISAIAGHSSCATTDAYLRRVAGVEVVTAMRSRPEW